MYFRFPAGIVTEAYDYVGYGNGDGDQDWIDNSFCNVWQGQFPEYTFYSEKFDGVEHMQMVSDAKVLSRIASILQALPSPSRRVD